jgi:hypothetical protein
MKLYHGTSERIAQIALKDGLLTRSKTSVASNWPKAESHPDQVYLTTAYAPFFAMQASENVERMAIIEIDSIKLEQTLFRPDEDFLEQATRTQKISGLRAKTMYGRTRWFRNNIDKFANHWNLSLDFMGTVAYKGDIPVEAITRLSLFDPTSNPFISSMVADPAINIMNFRFMGQKYVELTKWFFNEPVNENTLFFGQPDINGDSVMLEEIKSNQRPMIAMNQGIDVISVSHSTKG